MLESLCGVAGRLWPCCEPMALVLLSSVPSGLPEIVRAREKVESLMFHDVAEHVVSAARCNVVHSSVPLSPFPPNSVYVGTGLIDCQSRPSIFCNPYIFLTSDRSERSFCFYNYLYARADLESFLRPLAGRTLVCDCGDEDECHADILAEVVSEVFPLSAGLSGVCGRADFVA